MMGNGSDRTLEIRNKNQSIFIAKDHHTKWIDTEIILNNSGGAIIKTIKSEKPH